MPDTKSTYLDAYLDAAACWRCTPAMFIRYERHRYDDRCLGVELETAARRWAMYPRHVAHDVDELKRTLDDEVSAGRARAIVSIDGRTAYIRAHRIGYGDNGWHCGVCDRYVGPPHEDMANCRCQDCRPTPCDAGAS